MKNTEEIKSCATEKEIRLWLDMRNVRNYAINDDLSIDVYGDVKLTLQDEKYLRVQFRRVDGFFNCGFISLKSLIGAPGYVGGDFICKYNNLLTLEGCPSYVGGMLDAEGCGLKSLKGAAKVIKGGLNCGINNLTSLEGCPNELHSLSCYHNRLTSLYGGPNKIQYRMNCSYNEGLRSASGLPIFIGEKFICVYTKLESLEGLTVAQISMLAVKCRENPSCFTRNFGKKLLQAERNRLENKLDKTITDSNVLIESNIKFV